MSIAYPWLLPFALLPLLGIGLLGSKLANRTTTLIQGVAVACLLLAFAGPSLLVSHQLPLGVAVLVDPSTSDPQEQQLYAGQMAARLRTQQGIDWVQIFSPSADTGAGNVRSALRTAAVTVPEKYSPRILLISDGKQANGDLARAMVELQQMHVPVDVIPAPSGAPQLALASVTVQPSLYTGDRFPVEMSVLSPRPATAQVLLEIEGGKRVTQSAQLQAGMNVIRAQQSTASTGPVVLSGNIWAKGLGEVSFQRLAQFSRAKVVYFSPDSSPDHVLVRGLRATGTQVSQIAMLTPRSLLGVQLLVLGAESLTVLTPAQKDQLARFVAEGGGLLFLGGEAQPFKEHDAMDALDKALPAEPAPPENAADRCVVLLIDKSSSMEGAKLAMARQSANAIAEGLRPSDSLGVLAFDHGYQWTFPMQRIDHRQNFSRRLADLAASGGTDIPPALSAAYRAALLSKAKYRHLVLITDGISEEGDSVALAKEARRQQIAISTVALGNEVNRSFLDAVANESGGRSYVSATAQDLTRITLKDVRDYTGSRLVEHPFRPVVSDPRDVLGGVEVGAAPPLTRYSRYVSKPGAQVLLSIGHAAQHALPDPLYVQWQYGLGRVGLFTSDDLGPWAAGWRAPAGFDRLWSNVSRDLYARTPATEVVAVTDANGQGFQVQYTPGPNAGARTPLPRVVVDGPGSFSKTVQLEQRTPSSYGVHVSVGERSGIFRVVPSPAAAAFPATAVLVRPQGIGRPGDGQAALREIAQRTGGHFYAELPAMFPASTLPMQRKVDLWPWLVASAVLLNLAELAVRRH